MISLKVLSLSEYKKLKNSFVIHYAFHSSPFGKCLIGIHKQSICHLSFVNLNESKSLQLLKKEWPGAKLISEKKETGEVVKRVFSDEDDNFEVILKGTPFEEKVWQELLKIPKSKAKTYQEVAEMVGREKAVRAVANAVAKNFVCYLVPCHRVVSKSGDKYKYGCGPEVKKKLLEYEKCVL